MVTRRQAVFSLLSGSLVSGSTCALDQPTVAPSAIASTTACENFAACSWSAVNFVGDATITNGDVDVFPGFAINGAAALATATSEARSLGLRCFCLVEARRFGGWGLRRIEI
jgi:hypothetical protein